MEKKGGSRRGRKKSAVGRGEVLCFRLPEIWIRRLEEMGLEENLSAAQVAQRIVWDTLVCVQEIQDLEDLEE